MVSLSGRQSPENFKPASGPPTLNGDLAFSEDDRLYDLLGEWILWAEKRIGPEPTPEILCPDDSLLREELRHRITAHKTVDVWLGLDRNRPANRKSAALEQSMEIAGIIVEEEIGRGAMGVVYRGRQVALGRQVAVKVILAGTYAAASDLQRFRTEAVAIARIPHPNIVAIHDSGESRGLPYLVLEYLDGGSLAERLRGEPQAAALVG